MTKIVVQLSILKVGLGLLDRYSTKLFKSQMNSKITEPNQCFLERSYAVLIELNT